ncbi:acyl-CoA dehydrogenase family protein [Novosphingobium aquimarinum]|uniref:acyl-CoA dehydrogenase family protein n=1 Tax=Novosphingobium aquimarinum TaxID=2682494 RepID=UPI0012EC9E63|nr:acyl-CoA dehydrogenase family protein [Novosphingobium aquimarinum]
MMSVQVDDETLHMFRTMVDDYVRDRETVESSLPAGSDNADAGYRPQSWRSYSEMGWLSVSLDEIDGGFDGAPELVGAIMAGVGAGLLAEPIFTSAILCARLLRLIGWKGGGGITPAQIGSGETILTLAHEEGFDSSPWDDRECSYDAGRLVGTKVNVLHGNIASHILVTASDGAGDLVILLTRTDAPGISREDYRTLDGRWASTMIFDTAHGLPISEGSIARTALVRAIDESIVALCSEAWGAIRRLNEITRSYLRQREQFGRPIGNNQVLQHRMMECLIQQAEVRAVVLRAQRALRSSGEADRMRTVSGAMAVTAAAARHIGYEAVQMHGGIGMTHEYAVSHYFKRLRMIELMLGQRRHHLRRFAEYRKS